MNTQISYSNPVKTVVLLVFLLNSMAITGHSQQLKIIDAISWMGKSKVESLQRIKGAGFQYQGKDLDFLVFTKAFQLGTCKLTVGFKYGLLNTLSWDEWVGFAAEEMQEVLSGGFEPVQIDRDIRSYKNSHLGLHLTLIDHSADENTISINLGGMRKR
jgi:hypothetical protein